MALLYSWFNSRNTVYRQSNCSPSLKNIEITAPSVKLLRNADENDCHQWSLHTSLRVQVEHDLWISVYCKAPSDGPPYNDWMINNADASCSRRGHPRCVPLSSSDSSACSPLRTKSGLAHCETFERWYQKRKVNAMLN